MLFKANPCPDRTCFFSRISFLTRCMHIFGLYFVVNDSKKHKDGENRRTCWNAGRVYSTDVFVILWLNLARMMSCFGPNEVWGLALLFKCYSVLILFATNLMMTCHYVAYSNGKLSHLLGEICRCNFEADHDLEPLVTEKEMITVERSSSDICRSGDSTEFEDCGVPSMDRSDGSNKSSQVETLSVELQQ